MIHNTGRVRVRDSDRDNETVGVRVYEDFEQMKKTKKICFDTMYIWYKHKSFMSSY